MQVSLLEPQPPRETSGRIELTYTGGATENKSIDAEFYARSLLGFGKSFKKITSKFLHTDYNIQLLEEKANCWKAIVDFSASADVQAITTIMTWLTFFGISAITISKLPIDLFDLIIKLIKQSKGKSKEIDRGIETLDLPYANKEELRKIFRNIDFREALDEMTLF